MYILPSLSPLLSRTCHLHTLLHPTYMTCTHSRHALRMRLSILSISSLTTIHVTLVVVEVSCLNVISRRRERSELSHTATADFASFAMSTSSLTTCTVCTITLHSFALMSCSFQLPLSRRSSPHSPPLLLLPYTMHVVTLIIPHTSIHAINARVRVSVSLSSCLPVSCSMMQCPLSLVPSLTQTHTLTTRALSCMYVTYRHTAHTVDARTRHIHTHAHTRHTHRRC